MKTKTYFFALIPAALIGFALRIFQLLDGVEPDTAFFRENEPINIVFLIWTAVATLFFLSAAFLTRPEKKPLERTMIRLHFRAETVRKKHGLQNSVSFSHPALRSEDAGSFHQRIHDPALL